MIRCDEKSDFVWALISHVALWESLLFSLIFVYSLLRFYPLHSIPIICLSFSLYLYVWPYSVVVVATATVFVVIPFFLVLFCSISSRLGIAHILFRFLSQQSFLKYSQRENCKKKKKHTHAPHPEREKAQRSVHFYLSLSSHWFENRLFCILIVETACLSVRMEWYGSVRIAYYVHFIFYTGICRSEALRRTDIVESGFVSLLMW